MIAVEAIEGEVLAGGVAGRYLGGCYWKAQPSAVEESWVVVVEGEQLGGKGVDAVEVAP